MAAPPALRTVRRLSAGEARRVPWKNGRGVTEELALWPPGASFERGDFAWRIACAAVDEAGPFSDFPGFDRVLVVTSGAGLRLAHGSRAPRVRVLPLRPQCFSGDWPTHASLIEGPVADVNVLTRRGAVSAEVTVLRPGPRSLHVRELLEPGHTFVHVTAGEVEASVSGAVPAAWAGAGDAVTLTARESLWVTGAPESGGVLLELGGGHVTGVVLLVQLRDAAGADG